MGRGNKIIYNFQKDQVIANLIILDGILHKQGHRSFYLVKCNKCDREFKKDAYNLYKNQPCKCIWKENHSSFNGYELISGSYFASIRAGARTRNINFNLTIEELWTQLVYQDFKCALSGLQLSISPYDKDKWSNTASVDRKLSDEGYNIHNIQWVHKDVNKMKNNYRDSYFINMCKLISNNNERLF